MLKRFIENLLGTPGGGAPSSTIRLPLATCVVLVEAARADDSFTEEERSHIIQTLQQHFALTEEEANELLSEASRASQESVGLFRFTHAINEGFTPEEKRRVIEEVWRIFYSDGTLTGHEDHLAHHLGKLLNLNHPQLMEAKMRVLQEARQQGN